MPIFERNHLSQEYRSDIDGLRAVAILAVVLFHAFPECLRGGFIGVDIFFVISGYLISTIIYSNLSHNSFKFSDFYARRINRIFPSLLIVLIASYIFGWNTLQADEFKQLGKHIASGAGFISNLTLLNESGYFDTAAETKPLLHLWSLGIEEQFYIFFPLLTWIFWKYKLNIITPSVLIFTISFLLNIDGIEKNSISTFYLPQTRSWELFSGAILAWLLIFEREASTNSRTITNGSLRCLVLADHHQTNRTLLRNSASTFGILAIIYGLFFIDKNFVYPGIWALIPVAGTVLTIAAGPHAYLNKKILSNKFLVWFGLISFPLYLWHWPILAFARIIEGKTLDATLRTTAVILSTLLAYLTYRLVERPIRLSQIGKVKIISLSFIMAVVGITGYVTYNRDGLRFREAAKTSAQAREDLRKAENSLRQIEIRAGVCHFNRKGKHIELVNFLEHWNCLSNDENLRNTRVLVFGDSHSADKAMGLRLIGVDIVQLGGGGCSVNPDLAFDQKSHCRDLFSLIRRFDSSFDSIILSNEFPASQITENNLAAIVKYWSGEKAVYLFTPMPDFTDQMNEYRLSGKITSKPNFSNEDAFLRIIDRIKLPSNFKIIRTSDIWCANRDSDGSHPCLYEINDALLMTDGGHLTIAGSKIFAENMLSHPSLKILKNDYQ